MKASICAISSVMVFLLLSVASLSAQAPGQEQQPEFVMQSQQLMRVGKLDDALALYLQTLQISPNSLAANIAAGNVLDLLERGEEARLYFAKAIQVADKLEHKDMARRAMAMSNAFEGNCRQTVMYEQQVFNYSANGKNSFSRARLPTKPPEYALIPAIWTRPISGTR